MIEIVNIQTFGQVEIGDTMKSFILILIILFFVIGGCSTAYCNSSKDLYKEGLSYQDKKDYKTAIEKFNELVMNYPKEPEVEDAILRIGDCFLSLDQYTSSIEIYNYFLQQYSSSTLRWDAYGGLGSAYYYIGQYATSTEWLIKYCNEFSKDSQIDRIKVSLGIDYMNLYLDSLAEKEFKEVLAKWPNSLWKYHAHLQLGQIYYDKNQISESKTEFSKATSSNADYKVRAHAYCGIGQCYEKEENFIEALKFYKEVINHWPNTVAAEKAKKFQLNLMKHIQ
jgi:TolA-binding protein